MSAFAAAVRALFANPHLSVAVVWRGQAGGAAMTRAVRKSPDEVTDFGGARVWTDSTRIDVMVSAIPSPRPGDRIEIGADAFVIQGEPIRDRERLIWTLDLRPA